MLSSQHPAPKSRVYEKSTLGLKLSAVLCQSLCSSFTCHDCCADDMLSIPEVAEGLVRVAHGAMAEDLPHSPLGLHTSQVCKPLVVQHLLLPAGPPHAGTLVAQPDPINLQAALILVSEGAEPCQVARKELCPFKPCGIAVRVSEESARKLAAKCEQAPVHWQWNAGFV